MRKFVLVVTLILALGVSAAYVAAQDKPAGPEPEKGMIIGTAISMPHLAMKGEVEGEDAAKAMEYEADKGFPIGILEDETNTIWVCVWRDSAPASHLETANAHFKGLMGKKVVAQGLKYQNKGASVLRASLVSEY